MACSQSSQHPTVFAFDLMLSSLMTAPLRMRRPVCVWAIDVANGRWLGVFVAAEPSDQTRALMQCALLSIGLLPPWTDQWERTGVTRIGEAAADTPDGRTSSHRHAA